MYLKIVLDGELHGKPIAVHKRETIQHLGVVGEDGKGHMWLGLR